MVFLLLFVNCSMLNTPDLAGIFTMQTNGCLPVWHLKLAALGVGRCKSIQERMSEWVSNVFLFGLDLWWPYQSCIFLVLIILTTHLHLWISQLVFLKNLQPIFTIFHTLNFPVW
jgi:hypothetical protein